MSAHRRRRRVPGPLRTAVAGILVLSALSCATGGRTRAPVLPLDPQALAARRPLLEPFRAELGGRVKAGKEKGRFKAGLGAIPPGFRLDIFHPISGTTLMSMGVQNGVLQAVWPAEGECLKASSSADLMERLLGVPVPAEDFLLMLSGHLYRDGEVEFLSIRHPPMAVAVEGAQPPGAGDRLIVMAVNPATGARWEGELLAQRQGRALRGRREDSAGGEVLLEYPRWQPLKEDGSGGFPGRVEVRVPARNLKLEVEIRQMVRGGPSAADLLPTLPAGCRLLTPDTLPSLLPLGATLDEADR